ncbi:MAG: DUF2147 domain-containing protein [Alphaproteobacteria bacterium]|nr:DUF2147 domain-containing protein [Alphaproteobacteria bacterium]
MNFKFLPVMGVALMSNVAIAAVPLTGLYQTIDDTTNQPKSVVMLYEYARGDDVVLGGRIVALYDAAGAVVETVAHPVKIADRVAGAPTFVGLDIIRDMKWDADDNRFSDGKIMDPQSGKVYSSIIWQDAPGTLNVRGKIGPFGRTQIWRAVDAATLPTELQNLNTKNWTPSTGK